MNMNHTYSELYLEYVCQICPEIDQERKTQIRQLLEQTNWDEPQSFLDLNNQAVIALVEAEKAEDANTRALYLETAISMLNEGISHPLCAAHLALIHAIIGKTDIAIQIAFSTLIQSLQPAFTDVKEKEVGLIYLPVDTNSFNQNSSLFLQLFSQENVNYPQSALFLAEVLQRSQPIFYNAMGLRLLQLTIQLLPNSPEVNLKLGLTNLSSSQEEGLLYLHRAVQLSPQHAQNLQALYLAYRDLGQAEIANFWLNTARSLGQEMGNISAPDWYWTAFTSDHPITYVPFGKQQILAVEASLQSIVTLVLLGAGAWFEAEMEFWQDSLQPGMTVIDVGANVGVYTFSAAEKVGAEGKVYAIEPFSGCVRCLEESCQVNQIDWVKVCAGAASDRSGTARLSLNNASELNEILPMDNNPSTPDSYEEVACFTLDSLIEAENLQQVDFLKIDAENHEMAVLAGSDKLLTEFSPVILYENIAGIKGANLPVANFLQAKGYQLFYYQPFIKKLVPIHSVGELENRLNIIAIPQDKVLNFLP
jgi:FkbM family methyltransferase